MITNYNIIKNLKKDEILIDEQGIIYFLEINKIYFIFDNYDCTEISLSTFSVINLGNFKVRKITEWVRE